MVRQYQIQAYIQYIELVSMQSDAPSEQQTPKNNRAYPCQLQSTENKINEVENQILKIIIKIKQKQLAALSDKDPLNSTNQLKNQLNTNLLITSWQKEDEIDCQSIQYINKCCTYYEEKLLKEETRFIELRNQSKQRISNQEGQITHLKQQLERTQKEADRAKSRIKKLETDWEEVKNYRKNQKERIVEMLIQQKQQIYTKYNQIEKQNMVLLQFVHKMEDLLQKKTDEKEQDPSKISIIKQIQLEASKFYSSLTSPIIQQILNSFTQAINSLYKKFEKLDKREETKSTKKERDSRISNGVATLKLKSSMGKQRTNINFEIAHLKEQIAKITATYEQRLKQMQNNLSFQKQKGVHMKKKIEKYQEELQKRNNQMQVFQLKQEDTIKKMKWLQQSLLDYKRKLKMEKDDFQTIIKRGTSTIEQQKPVQIEDEKKKMKSKSLFIEKIGSLSSEAGIDIKQAQRQINEEFEQQAYLKEEVKELEEKIRKADQELINKNEKLEELEKWGEELKRMMMKTQKQIDEKSNKLEEQNKKIEQKDMLINSLNIQVHKLTEQLVKKEENINTLSLKLQQKSKYIKIKQDKDEVTLQMLSNIIKRQPFNCQFGNQMSLAQKRNKELMNEIEQLIRRQSSQLMEKDQKLSEKQQQIEKLQIQKKGQIEKMVNQLKLLTQKNEKEQQERREDHEKMTKEMKKIEEYNRKLQDQLKNRQDEAERTSKKLEQLQKVAQQVQKVKADLTEKQSKLQEIKQAHIYPEQQFSKQKSNLLAEIQVQKQKVIEQELKFEELYKQFKILNQTMIQKQQELAKQRNQVNSLKKIIQNLQHKQKQHELIIEQLQNQVKQKQEIISQRNSEIEKLELTINHQINELTLMKGVLLENQKLIQDNKVEISQLTNRIAELEEKVNQSRENHDSEADNQQNLNQSKEINMMQEQIISFKEQLYNLLGTIKQKDDQIKQLTATLRDKTQEQSQKKRRFSKTKSLDINLQAEANDSKNKQDTMSVREEKNEEVQRLTKIIIEQEQQIEILKTHLTKKQILSSKVMDLQSILNKEKQMYQNQLTKNHEKILNLQSQIRQLKQSPVKNKRVLSEEYFSIQPISNSNKVSSEEKFNQKNSEKNIFNNLKQKNSNDEGGSEVFHSLEEDFVEETKNRRKEAQELDKEIRGRIRRQKSQELQRSKYGERRVQKMSSIQKCYDSDVKSKEQNDMKYEMTPIKKENFSPINEKIQNNLEKQKAAVKGFPSIASHEEIPHITNSDNSALNELIKSLTEENKNLKVVHEKLKRDFVQISQLMQIFDKNWKNQKTVQNCSELGKLVSTQKLMENIKLLENNKLKLFQEFNSSDMEAIFDNMTKLISETKRWVDLIQRLTVQNNKASLQMALFKKNPKLIKTKTSRVTGDNEDHHRRSRSVYSEGNVYKQLHIDVDQIAFELHDDHQPATQTNVNVPTNSLEMLFKENIQMSEISSVRNKSHNSGFLNSKSEIAKMFEKGGERQQKEHKEIKKQEQIKKDIVDDYITLNMHKVEKDKNEKSKNHALNINLSSNKIQQSRIQANLLQNSPLMQKNSSNYIQQASYQDIYYGKRLDDKSSKAKKKLMEKASRKINTINSKISQNKKEFAVIIKNIIHKYEQKISQLQNQFSATVKKIMQFSTTIGSQKKIPAAEVQNQVQQNKQMNKMAIENSVNGKCKVSGRISEKDEQLYERVEELETLIQKYKQDTQNKEKAISEAKEQSKQFQKKLKEQKAAHESLKIKYLNEVSCSTNLKQILGKKDQDFLRFITKIINTPKDKSLLNNEVSVQADPEIQSQLSPTIEGQKKFLKSKKNSVKNESLTIIEAKKIEPNLTKQAESSLQSKNQNISKNETSIKTIEVANQNSKMENLLNFSDEIKESENIEKKETKQLQLATSFGRIKSEPLQVGNKRKQEKLRQSDKSESDSGKPLSIGAMINSILNPNTTLSKKKNISDVSKPDQVMYYQQLLKDINHQIKQVLLKNFLVDKVEDKKMINSEDQIFKSKKQRETKVKVEQEKDKEKEKEKQVEKSVKDEDEINEKLKLLESQIANFKKDGKKAKQEQQNRFRTILKRLIYSFKISKKSIERVINQVEKQDNNNAAKYIDARLFFKSLYNQTMEGKQQNKTMPLQNNEPNVNLQPQSSYLNDFCQQFESFEEKYNELQRQNDQLKLDLDIKTKQIQSLKQETTGHLDQKKTNSRNQSFASYQNDDQFQDFENKQIFDNTKPTFEVMETLKLELEFYKKKCEQFEASLNSKKSDKLKYIRRW